jgi:hypothetical protein
VSDIFETLLQKTRSGVHFIFDNFAQKAVEIGAGNGEEFREAGGHLRIQ